MKRHYYKLRRVRVEYRPDAYATGYDLPVVTDEDGYLQSNGRDVLVKGYASAITRAGELNSAIRREGKWDEGWRFHVKEVTMEEQGNLFDVDA